MGKLSVARRLPGRGSPNTAIPHTAAIRASNCRRIQQPLRGSQDKYAWQHPRSAHAAQPNLKDEGRFRLVAAGDLARLNVSSERGHLSFKDERVERPLHCRHRPLNTCKTGRALRTTPCAWGERLCPTHCSRSMSRRQRSMCS